MFRTWLERACARGWLEAGTLDALGRTMSKLDPKLLFRAAIPRANQSERGRRAVLNGAAEVAQAWFAMNGEDLSLSLGLDLDLG